MKRRNGVLKIFFGKQQKNQPPRFFCSAANKERGPHARKGEQERGGRKEDEKSGERNRRRRGEGKVMESEGAEEKR